MLKKFDLLMGFFFGGVRARRPTTHVPRARDRVAALTPRGHGFSRGGGARASYTLGTSLASTCICGIVLRLKTTASSGGSAGVCVSTAYGTMPLQVSRMADSTCS